MALNLGPPPPPYPRYPRRATPPTHEDQPRRLLRIKAYTARLEAPHLDVRRGRTGPKIGFIPRDPAPAVLHQITRRGMRCVALGLQQPLMCTAVCNLVQPENEHLAVFRGHMWGVGRGESQV